jgi:hypothetical protein
MALLDRRALIAGALGAATVPRMAQAAPRANLRFNILRNGRPFGLYTVVFGSSGDLLTVTSDVAMSAKISGLTVFAYRLHVEETWRGDRFLEMHSHSSRDRQADQEFNVSAVRTPTGGIKVTNRDGLVALNPAAHPLTHWNQDTLAGPLFNPQTGYPVAITAKSLGHDPVILASGQALRANHWALRGESQIDDWYDDAGVWAGLKAVFPDKSIIEYRRA